MPEREHPTIPQIVQALITLSDRERDARETIRDAQGEIEALRNQLLEARAQACHAFGRETWYANAVDRLRDKFGRDAVDPIVKAARLAYDFNQLTPEQQEAVTEDGERRAEIASDAVECDCGQTWPDGKMEPGHGDMNCQAEPCPTQIDVGPCQEHHTEPCAGTRGHPGYCKTSGVTSVAAPEPLEKRCRCGHDEERHTTSLPEEGSQDYCIECDGPEGDHSFVLEDPDDICECGCKRKDHLGLDSGWGAQCRRCPGDGERSWRHAFKLKEV